MFDEWEICSYGTIPYLSTSKATRGNPGPHPADEKVPETFSNPSIFAFSLNRPIQSITRPTNQLERLTQW